MNTDATGNCYQCFTRLASTMRLQFLVLQGLSPATRFAELFDLLAFVAWAQKIDLLLSIIFEAQLKFLVHERYVSDAHQHCVVRGIRDSSPIGSDIAPCRRADTHLHRAKAS